MLNIVHPDKSCFLTGNSQISPQCWSIDWIDLVNFEVVESAFDFSINSIFDTAQPAC